MAISYRAGSFTKATTNALAVTAPAGVQAGDVLLLGLLTEHTPTVTAPSGWTRLEGTTIAGGTHLWHLWEKLADGTEGSTYTFSLSDTEFAEAVVAAFVGCNQSTPYDTHAIRDATADNTAPTIATTHANEWIVLGLADWNGTTPTNPDQGYTEASGTPSSFDACFYGYKGPVAAGTYGGETFSGDPTVGGGIWLIGLIPAGGSSVSGGGSLVANAAISESAAVVAPGSLIAQAALSAPASSVVAPASLAAQAVLSDTATISAHTAVLTTNASISEAAAVVSTAALVAQAVLSVPVGGVGATLAALAGNAALSAPSASIGASGALVSNAVLQRLVIATPAHAVTSDAAVYGAAVSDVAVTAAVLSDA